MTQERLLRINDPRDFINKGKLGGDLCWPGMGFAFDKYRNLHGVYVSQDLDPDATNYSNPFYFIMQGENGRIIYYSPTEADGNITNYYYAGVAVDSNGKSVLSLYWYNQWADRHINYWIKQKTGNMDTRSSVAVDRYNMTFQINSEDDMWGIITNGTLRVLRYASDGSIELAEQAVNPGGSAFSAYYSSTYLNEDDDLFVLGCYWSGNQGILRLAIYDDSGTSWSQFDIKTWNNSSTTYVQYPSIFVDKNRYIHATCAMYDASITAWNTFYFRSTDGGSNWSETQLTIGNGWHGGQQSQVIGTDYSEDGNQTLYRFVQKRDTTGIGYDVRYQISTNYGANWGAEQILFSGNAVGDSWRFFAPCRYWPLRVDGTTSSLPTGFPELIILDSANFDFYFYQQISEDTSQWTPWPSGWDYGCEVDVANDTGSDLTNIQVDIYLNTEDLINDSKMKSDCGDIRIYDSDKTTSLSYWVDPSTIDTTRTRIVVKIPSLPSAGKTIYLYYGNNSASSESSGSSTFHAFDTFDNLDNWETSGSPTISSTKAMETGGNSVYFDATTDIIYQNWLSDITSGSCEIEWWQCVTAGGSGAWNRLLLYGDDLNIYTMGYNNGQYNNHDGSTWLRLSGLIDLGYYNNGWNGGWHRIGLIIDLGSKHTFLLHSINDGSEDNYAYYAGGAPNKIHKVHFDPYGGGYGYIDQYLFRVSPGIGYTTPVTVKDEVKYETPPVTRRREYIAATMAFHKI